MEKKIITISREFGSGGRTIGKKVAEKLGIPFYDRELVNLLLGDVPLPFPNQYLSIATQKFREAGFEIHMENEAFRTIRFYDVGALVWFARIISWEFPGFSVEKCFENLLSAQRILEKQGFKVVRFWNNEIYENIEGVVLRLKEEINPHQEH